MRRVERVVRLERSNPTTRPELPVFLSCVATALSKMPRPQPRSNAVLTQDQSLTELTMR